MIVTEGGRWGGYGLLCSRECRVRYNMLALLQAGGRAISRSRPASTKSCLTSGTALASQGRHRVLKVGGKEVAAADPKTVPFLLPADKTFDVGTTCAPA
jgi:arylsulfatase